MIIRLMMRHNVRLMTTRHLDLATSALIPGYRRLRAVRVSPFSQRHASNGHRTISSRLWLLNIYLTVIGYPLVVRHVSRTIRRVLQLSAKPLLGLSHRRNGGKLLQQGVSSEGTLNGQGSVSRLDTAVLSFQHLDLLVQQVLGEFVPVPTEVVKNR